MVLKIKKTIFLMCCVVIDLFAMRQSENELKKQLIDLKNDLESVTAALETSKSKELQQLAQTTFSIETIALNLVDQLMPPVIEDENQLLSVLQKVSNFQPLNTLWSNDNFLRLLKERFIQKITSVVALEDFFKKVKYEKNLRIKPQLQELINDIYFSLLGLQDVARTNDTKRMEKLLNEGYSPNTITVDGFTLLESAIKEDRPSMIDFLLKNGAKINLVTPNLEIQHDIGYFGRNKTPLYVAIRSNKIDLAIDLLNKGADPLVDETISYLITDELLKNPRNNKKIGQFIRMLIEKGVDPQSDISNSSTMLEQAVINNDEDLVRFLLNYSGIKKDRALNLARDRNNQLIINLLENYAK